MGLFKILEAAVKTVVVLPVAVVKDVVTGDIFELDQPSSTRKTIESIAQDIDEIAD